MKPGSLIAIIIFIGVAIAHLVRLITGSEIKINDTVIPIWISITGFIVPLIVVFLLIKEQRK